MEEDMKIRKYSTWVLMLLLALAWTMNGCEFVEFVTEPETGTDIQEESRGDMESHIATEAETEPNLSHVHDFRNETKEKEPTCTETGVYVYTCACCESMSVNVEATRHKFVDRVCEYCQIPRRVRAWNLPLTVTVLVM